MAAKRDYGVRGSISQRFADRELDRGCEIGRLARRKASAFRGDLTHRSLQPGEREIAAWPALEGPWQRKTGGVSILPRPLDCRPARVAEPDHLSRFVERFS